MFFQKITPQNAERLNNVMEDNGITEHNSESCMTCRGTGVAVQLIHGEYGKPFSGYITAWCPECDGKGKVINGE